jgi:hypothetical protein
LKRRKFDDSDDEISEGSNDFSRMPPMPQNEYRNMNLSEIVDNLITYTKKLENIKVQKSLQTQIREKLKLQQENMDQKAELEKKVTITL